jgi:hypothetical protein
MRKFTKSLMTLGLLLIAGVASAKETKVFSLDFSEVDSYDFWYQEPDGSSITLEDGLLVITNDVEQANFWDLQFDIAEGFRAAAGLDYKITVEYKSTVGGGVWIGMGTGKGYGNADRVTNYGASISESDDFKTLTWNVSYPNTSDDNYVIMQCGGRIGTISIKKVEVIEITPDAPTPSVIFGDDLAEVDAVMYVKNYGESAGVITDPDADGIYTIQDEAGSGDAWATQFWIKGEYALPVGQKFYVEFDYMADAAGTVGTQTHGERPGTDYIIWHCIGDVEFKDDWDHFEKEVTIESDMAGWQSIAFNMHLNSDTKYYIKNIVLKESEIVGEAVDFTVGSIGWASYCCFDKDVNLGETKGYAAVFNGKSVDLIPVTEVPAGEAVLIEGAGKQTFEVIGRAAAIDENDLQADTDERRSDGTYYALADGSQGIGFYKVAELEYIPAGKAFMVLVPNDAPEFIPFNNGTTSISEKTVVKNNAEGEYYNLAGQRVAQPTKGLYIVNGKKVIK